MNEIMRPTRGGRPNKVIRNSAVPGTTPSRARVRTAQAHLQHALSDDVVHKQPEYDDGAIMNELNVAAAAAAAAAAMSVADNADLGEAEADADMEDDDQDLHHHQQHHDQSDHMDLNTAANILANGGSVTSGGQLTPAPSTDHQHHQMQQHHQPPASMGGPSPHSLDQHNQNLDPSFVRTTEELARESGYGTLNVESALAKRLAREPGLRLAQQRRPDQQLNLQRRSNVEALFAHIAGELAPAACKNCHKGHGPWTSCVVVDGQMCGSCANCWFNASGARCSFHGKTPSSALSLS
jgi:3-dehydrosphinganine reductase